MFLAITRYGLIACQYLVKGYAEGHYVAAPEIAEKYNMNVRALMPALRQLTKAGILYSRVGGSKPGFIFAKDPKNISVLDIILALEGDTQFMCTKDLMPDITCECSSKKECILYEKFREILEQAKKTLSTMLITEYKSAK